MKTFRDLLIEATGLKKVRRVPRKRQAEVLKKFAMRQAVRAANKVGSDTVIPPVNGVGGKVSSSEGIIAQFGANVQVDPTTGYYTKSKWTPTEDEALVAGHKVNTEVVDTFKKTFVKRFKDINTRSLGSY